MSFSAYHRSIRSHALIWAALLCLALGTLAQAGHIHATPPAQTHVQCELCLSFGGLMDAPQPTTLVVNPDVTACRPFPLEDVFCGIAVHGLPQARAPPRF